VPHSHLKKASFTDTYYDNVAQFVEKQ